jgi:hypothetical protein
VRITARGSFLAVAPLIVAASASADGVPQGPNVQPAAFEGEVPGAGGPVRWHFDLTRDGRFQARQTFTNEPAPNVFHDIGRWR